MRCVVKEIRDMPAASSMPLVLVSTEPDGVAAEDGTAVFLVSVDLLGPAVSR
ncbi:hypothetical protein MicB006_3655 [Micromonospora sp. B006]|nr:hypothetical protein MicB006_3655 [Micromonospora sp. B006]